MIGYFSQREPGFRFLGRPAIVVGRGGGLGFDPWGLAARGAPGP